MRLFFDSSVLIPVFYADQPDHAASTHAFRAARKHEAFCAMRTLGEVYSVLTGLPVRPRITGREGARILEQLRERLTVISLAETEYFEAIESVSDTIVGGAIYDALVGRCALKARADVLLTWNRRDFARLGDEIAALVRTPAELNIK